MKHLSFTNSFARLQINDRGRVIYFGAGQAAANVCAGEPAAASIIKAGRKYPATFARGTQDGLELGFGESGATARLAFRVCPHYFVAEVRQVSDPDVEEILFLDIPLQADRLQAQALAACALALNIRTKVEGFPGDQNRLSARAFRALAFTGARAAVMVCPRAALREALQQAVQDAPELPHSPLGGPWALDAPVNRGSYIFDRGVTESNVDDYIRVLRTLGISQLNIYGRYRAYRHGDFKANPELYPRGRASLKAVIDKLHAAGILAGFHSLSFVIDGNSRWITPRPDARLAKDAVYHLAGPLSADAPVAPVAESLAEINPSPTARSDNSLTLQIDGELIEFQAVRQEGVWAFTGCKRGAWGTAARPHRAGAPVARLSQVWGHFVPGGHSDLLPEIAAAAAELVNECGFDMAYFDGLDGEDRLGDPALGWHYGARYVYEFCRRLQRPLLLEMATFHHHLWVVRSRIGAWDYPTKNYRRFVDHHAAANLSGERIMLPAQLGWWSSTLDSRWAGIQGDRMFLEDVEYWCGKALGTGAGLSLVGPDMNPDQFFAGAANQAAARIIRDYETLRLAGAVDRKTRAALAQPGAEFKLIRQDDGRQVFQPRHTEKYRMTSPAGKSAALHIVHQKKRQPVMLRLEPLFSIMPYDADGGITLADFTDAHEFSAAEAEPDYECEFSVENTGDALRPRAARYQARRLRRAAGAQGGARPAPEAHGMRSIPGPEPAWTRIGKKFNPPLNLCRPQTETAGRQSDWAAIGRDGQLETGDRLGLGFWVEGDGSGAVLNAQLVSPRHISGFADHYVVLDFTGWRYVELVEAESARLDDYGWPYSGNLYKLYRSQVDFKQIEGLNLWLNNIPDDRNVSVRISPIRALPLAPMVMRQPEMMVGKNFLKIPMDIGTGDYVELDNTGCCRRFDSGGELVETSTLLANALVLDPGGNMIEVNSKFTPSGLPARMRLTLICDVDNASTLTN